MDIIGKILALWSGMAAEMTRQKLVSMLNGGICDRILKETMALHRIDNYRRSFELFVEGIKELERVVSRDKNESYNYKQLLAGRYYKIKLQAGRYLGETTGLLKYMPYINGELPYIDGKELEEWNKNR